MRRLLESDSTLKDFKKSYYSHVLLTILVFALYFITSSIDRNYFDPMFYLEFVFLFVLFRFYHRAHKNKNYAYWGISGLIFIYLLFNILHYTFIETNLLIQYISILSIVFLGINGYVLSSPLYYPRVQWWEYDFRYRGELKINTNINGLSCEGRLADLRRGCASILSLENLPLGHNIDLEIPFGKNTYHLTGVIKTMREVIPGRPIRYGIELSLPSEKDKKSHDELRKIWALHKKANIRRKFSEYRESNGIS